MELSDDRRQRMLEDLDSPDRLAASAQTAGRRSTPSPATGTGAPSTAVSTSAIARLARADRRSGRRRGRAPCSPTIAGSMRLIDGLAAQMRARSLLRSAVPRASTATSTAACSSSRTSRCRSPPASPASAQLAAKKNGQARRDLGRLHRPAQRAQVREGRRRAPLLLGGAADHRRTSPPPTAGHCVRTGERRLADGEILVVDGRHQSLCDRAGAQQPRRPPGRRSSSIRRRSASNMIRRPAPMSAAAPPTTAPRASR